MPFRDVFFGNPTISEKAFVDPDATVIGNVTISDLCLVIAGCKIRADEGTPFFFGPETNLQEFTSVHGHENKFVSVEGKQYSVYVGGEKGQVTIAHRSTLHGPLFIGHNVFVGGNCVLWDAEIGSGCYIEKRATVDEGSKVGKNCYIGKHSLITNGVSIASNKLIPNNTVIDTQDLADTLKDITDAQLQFYRSKNSDIVRINVELVDKHAKRAKMLIREKNRQQFIRFFNRLKQLHELSGQKQLTFEQILKMEEEELMLMIEEFAK